MIIQLMPNRSRSCPNRVAKNVSCIGMNTSPPSERRKHALGVGIVVDAEREVGAAHRLGTLDIRAHQLGSADNDARMQDCVLHFWFDFGLIRWLPVSHHHSTFSAQMLLVAPERLRAF